MNLTENQKKEARLHFGFQIKAEREKQKLTQEQLAEKIGCKRGTVVKAENGTYSTGADILQQIANSLGKNWGLF